MHDFDEPGGFKPNRKKKRRYDDLKKATVAALTAAKARAAHQSWTLTLEDHDERAVIRIPNKLTVDYFTTKSRWRVRGQSKSSHSTVGQFLEWLETQLEE